MKKGFTIPLVALLVASQAAMSPLAQTTELTNIEPGDYSTNTGLNPTLQVTVPDLRGETAATAEFRKGHTYDFQRDTGINGFQGVSSGDPLKTVDVTKETPFNDADIADADMADGTSVETVSEEGFPYHRFEVNVKEELAAGDEVEVNWTGATPGDGKVTLSAWDYQAKKWMPLKEQEGNSQGSKIELTADVSGSQFERNGKVQAMVHASSVTPETDEDPFTMLWFTDTQYYAQDYPEVWESMTDYMVKEYQKGTFEYAMHTGDLVQVPKELDQWEVVDENLSKLEAADIPYGVLPGNHDIELYYDTGDNETRGIFVYDNYKKYVGADRFRDKPWYHEQIEQSGPTGTNKNHYDLFSFGEHKFIMLYLGYGTDGLPETIKWANSVLSEHSDYNAIIGMHENINSIGSYASSNAVIVNREIVSKNENVKMVLSGHHHGATREVKTYTNEDGSTREVLEVLSNHQGNTHPERGQGYLRLITFDPTDETVQFISYSPFWDDYNFEPFDEDQESFTANFDLFDVNGSPLIEKQLETDYVALNIYQEDKIGQSSDLQPGDTAAAEWKELREFTEYFWYVTIANKDEEVKSKLYRFTTGKAPVVDPEPEPEPTPDPEPDPEPNPDPTPEPNPLPFTDVAAKYYEAVNYLFINDISHGISETQFGISNNIKRADAAIMLGKALELDITDVSDSGFTDVPDRDQAREYISALKAAGIVNGKSDTSFGAHDNITRGEMAIMLANAYQLDASSDYMPFTDVAERYEQAVAALLEYDITQGTSETQFGVANSLTRGDYAIFLNRLNALDENE
ncbi:S-layer homology domain-containing protein [Planococcus salinus]|uniref:Metallophosphoesterase n=1 Tax=Planococcus salinus TaxID=1848460 RepID=A0A3M8PA15_9BACL|nr:S-layer homology domain-containing protein [Planococcus salinus]RNF40546.1 metallophosphoesterase [Planococcus salinus]